jgi:hypothetical protein
MSQNEGIKKLKVVLAVFFVCYLSYGVSFLFFPGIVYAVSGSPDPLGLSWIRWSGGACIALGFGALQVFRNPARQGLFVSVATISSLLIGLGLLYSKIFDNSTSALWFHMTPCVINLALFVLLVWARQGAREVLE